MADEFVCDTPQIRSFIAAVKEAVANTTVIKERLAAIRPAFRRVLLDPQWLPNEFRRPAEAGGMGKGIANWLLFRDTDSTLSLSALVLSPGTATPVHDHLAWGLVGLYAGEQDEEVYEAVRAATDNEQHAEVQLVARNRLHVGSFYELIPPAGDIHRVITISPEPSISIHLLGNDIGCILRHRFEPETGKVLAFRSGYTNKECEEGAKRAA